MSASLLLNQKDNKITFLTGTWQKTCTQKVDELSLVCFRFHNSVHPKLIRHKVYTERPNGDVGNCPWWIVKQSQIFQNVHYESINIFQVDLRIILWGHQVTWISTRSLLLISVDLRSSSTTEVSKSSWDHIQHHRMKTEKYQEHETILYAAVITR